MMTTTEQFRAAMIEVGMAPPDTINGDGGTQRFSTGNKSGNRNGWYYLHDDGNAWGQAGDWAINGGDALCTWSEKTTDRMTQAELDTMRSQQKAAKAQHDQERTEGHKAAAVTAKSIWDACSPANAGHGYLVTKGVVSGTARVIQAADAHRLCNRLSPELAGPLLVIPMNNAAGQLRSLQFITETGTKRPLTGGEKQGCYFAIGKPKGVIVICEGWATGASIFEATGEAVAVAFDAGNLYAVALALRNKYPSLKIIMAADDDHLTDGNPGMTKARAAALAVGGWLAVPEFNPLDRLDCATDFNDLHQFDGAGAVKACFENAIELIAGQAHLSGATGLNDVWPTPTPLPDELPPVARFTPDLLPESLRPWVLDIAHRMQCPPDFTAVAALVALSSLIGARAVVQPKERDDWQVTPNLWGAIVGRPGVKKSPALSEALRPLNRLQAEAFKDNTGAVTEWEIDCKLVAMQNEGNEKKAKTATSKGDTEGARLLLKPGEVPTEPQARRYIVNDATVEKLGELVQDNPWGILSYRDELYGLLTSMDKPGQENARGFYLQGYDGNQSYTSDRIMRGTVHIDRVCLSMVGGIQPGKIQEYVRGAMAGGTGDDGLLQRFGLTVWPDMLGDYVHVDQWPDTQAKQAAWAVFERLAVLQPELDDAPTLWRFTPGAQALFVQWLTAFEIELRGDELHPAIVSHLAKYRKLIPALALVFALIDTPDSDKLIYENEINRALAWCDYLRTHVDRLYSAATRPETTGAASLLAKINTGRLVDADGVLMEGFTPREIVKKGWAGLTTPDEVRKAADVLIDYDWLKLEVVKSDDSKGRGRPSDRYSINPAAMEVIVKCSMKIFKGPDIDPAKTAKTEKQGGNGVSAVSAGSLPAPLEIFNAVNGNDFEPAGKAAAADSEVF
jgi:putative DNA primase/helicase